jgi:hypothetical protein
MSVAFESRANHRVAVSSGRLWRLALLLSAAASGPGATASPLAPAPVVDAERSLPHVIMEGYPEDMSTALQRHEEQIREAARKIGLPQPLSFIVASTQRWSPGDTIDVAFRGGTPALYAQIEQAALSWTAPGVANLHLRFRDAAGAWNQWSSDDLAYRAEIRVAFDGSGYWSAIGKGSIDATLPGGGTGGTSMNLQGFDKNLPANWKSIVRHEFGHALGFMHEHQSPVGGCDFRYQNDPNYARPHPTDEQGWYRVDDAGNRPGLYTYLGGYSNHWSKRRVDANMRPITTSNAFEIGPFDKDSIMKYFFYAFEFEAGEKSACYTPNEAEDLSAGDIAGARKAYPFDNEAANRITQRNAEILEQLQSPESTSAVLKQSVINRSAPLDK